MWIRNRPFPSVLWTAGAVLAATTCATAQYAERPQLFGSALKGVDVSGRSVKDLRVRAVHTTDPNLLGGTAYLLERDPFLAYQLGRNLNFLEFTEKYGVFDAHIGNLAGPMPDGTTSKITANNQTSCLGCHNVPTGNPGGGPNFSKDSGSGRNSPHYFGAGVIEMLAQQVRADMLAQIDTNGNGWISAAEAQAAPTSCAVAPIAGASPIDFGNPRLSNGSTGRPALNNIFRVWYLDANGHVVPGATQVDGTATVGYGFEMVVWGWGQGVGRSALNPTNRAFLWDPFKTHSGLDSHDPSTRNDPDGDGVSVPTLAGAVQFPATHKSSDNGNTLDPLGFSRDDPDGDGYLTEISEGDLDLAEWFMLNAPRPAFAGPRPEYRAGVAAMTSMGCTVCHVADWTIQPRDAVHTGDRRFFDLNVGFNENSHRLEGKLVRLYSQQGASYVRNFAGTTIPAVFTDLKQHDMGDGFKEIDFGGTVNKTWRTPPLWGVGSGFPWGHDGRSLSLEDAILRHGGEAAAARAAWGASTPLVRSAVLTLLSKLVLYDIEDMPADIDGNGVISDSFFVAGMDTGRERFNAEWLFQVPVQIQGPVVNINGVTITSNAAVNLDAAYGRSLPFRLDTDGDAWPDVWDHAPTAVGWKDGVN